jgi:hypothetical protein
VCRTGELHPSFPRTGEHAPTQAETEVESYLNVFSADNNPDRKLPQMSFTYAAGKGNTSLKFHLKRYHAAEYRRVLGRDDNEQPAKSSKRQSGDKPGEAVLGKFFRSVKKARKDSARAQSFFRMVTLLIVFARLPFNIVVNPVFKAFVWFLDPTLPFPTRGDITGTLLPGLVSECRRTVLGSLDRVLGVAVTFDLWMSKKTDDILSIDLHFVSSRWTWEHKHLALVAMNGQTRGAVVAKKLKDVFDEFNVMGKLYAMVYDGGANLASAKQEIMRIRDNEFCCTALQEKNIHITSCLAHLINNSCNGAVLAAKDAQYKVNPLPVAAYLLASVKANSLTCVCCSVDIRPTGCTVSIAVMHHLDKEELKGVDDLQECLCTFEPEGSGIYNACEDKVLQCKCMFAAWLLGLYLLPGTNLFIACPDLEDAHQLGWLSKSRQLPVWHYEGDSPLT